MNKQPDIEQRIDAVISGLVAARVAAVHTADEQLEFADNSEIAELANKLLDEYMAQAKAELLTIVNEAVVAELKSLKPLVHDHDGNDMIADILADRIAELTTRKDKAE